MKFAVNRYSLTYHIVKDDPLPMPVGLESLPFGLPTAFEMREIWTIDISNLDELLALVQRLGMSVELSQSPFWSGPSVADAGDHLFGLSLFDDYNVHLIDPRDAPVLVAAKGKDVLR